MSTLAPMVLVYHGNIHVMENLIVTVDVMRHVDIHANADDTYCIFNF